MTYKELIELQFTITEKEYDKAIKEIVKYYHAAYVEASKRVRILYDKITEEVVKASATGKPLTVYAAANNYNRLNEAIKQIQSLMSEAAKAAGRDIGIANELVETNMYYRSVYTLNWAESGYGIFPVLNDSLVKASVYGTESVWKTIKDKEKWQKILPQYGTLSDLLVNDNVQALNKIKTEMNQGLILGDSYAKIKKRLLNTFDGSASNTMRVVRTEGNRNLNAGNFIATQNAIDEGVKINREWNATLDINTRRTHAQADGQKEDNTGNFHLGGATGPYPSQLSSVGENVNCRCSVISYPPDLPPTARRARDPVKQTQWENATAAERKAGELKDGTKIYSRSQQTDIISNTSFPAWMEQNNLKFNKSGKIVLK